MRTQTKNALWCVLMEDGGWGYRSDEWMPDPHAIAKLDPSDLLRQPGLGKVAMKEIEAYLAEHNLRFERTSTELRWNLARIREREAELAGTLQRVRERIAEIEAELKAKS